MTVIPFQAYQQIVQILCNNFRLLLRFKV